MDSKHAAKTNMRRHFVPSSGFQKHKDFMAPINPQAHGKIKNQKMDSPTMMVAFVLSLGI
jgi:hypothetical protein